jgi:hypothetical protein
MGKYRAEMIRPDCPRYGRHRPIGYSWNRPNQLELRLSTIAHVTQEAPQGRGGGFAPRWAEACCLSLYKPNDVKGTQRSEIDLSCPKLLG